MLGDVKERFNILKNCNQKSLAYLTAATHGLDDEASEMAEQIEAEGKELPILNPNAKLFKGPLPIQQAESNWPLLTVSRGFFEGQQMSKQAGTVSKALATTEVLDTEIEGCWDDADLKLDDEDEDNDDMKDALDTVEGEGAGWDVGDDDIELPEELANKLAQSDAKDGNFFAAPTKGVPQTQIWVNGSLLAADHIRAGSFETAFRILNEQVGVVNFEPYKKLFMFLFAGSRTSYSCLPNLPSKFTNPHRNWKEAGLKNGHPTVGVRLNDLVALLQVTFT